MFKSKDYDADLIHILLKLPWTHSSVFTKPDCLLKMKCISIQVACKIIRTESDLEVLDFGLHDEMEEVRHEAVLSMPVVAFWSDFFVLPHIFRRLE